MWLKMYFPSTEMVWFLQYLKRRARWWRSFPFAGGSPPLHWWGAWGNLGELCAGWGEGSGEVKLNLKWENGATKGEWKPRKRKKHTKTMTSYWKTCTIWSAKVGRDLIDGGSDEVHSYATLPPHPCPQELRMQREKAHTAKQFNLYSSKIHHKARGTWEYTHMLILRF